jgi:hypothetical protein
VGQPQGGVHRRDAGVTSGEWRVGRPGAGVTGDGLVSCELAGEAAVIRIAVSTPPHRVGVGNRPLRGNRTAGGNSGTPHDQFRGDCE